MKKKNISLKSDFINLKKGCDTIPFDEFINIMTDNQGEEIKRALINIEKYKKQHLHLKRK